MRLVKGLNVAQGEERLFGDKCGTFKTFQLVS